MNFIFEIFLNSIREIFPVLKGAGISNWVLTTIIISIISSITVVTIIVIRSILSEIHHLTDSIKEYLEKKSATILYFILAIVLNLTLIVFLITSPIIYNNYFNLKIHLGLLIIYGIISLTCILLCPWMVSTLTKSVSTISNSD